MNAKHIFLFIICIALLSSCGSSRKGSSRLEDSSSSRTKDTKDTKGSSRFDNSSSPYVKEVTVREEKVKVIDADDVVFGYYVIIGSFKVVENARKFRGDVVKEGFSAVILENESGLYRVSVGSFNDEQAARNKILQIRKNYEKYSDVWLLIRKK